MLLFKDSLNYISKTSIRETDLQKIGDSGGNIGNFHFSSVFSFVYTHTVKKERNMGVIFIR